MTTTTDLLTEYNQLDAQHLELRRQMRETPSDEILDALNRNVFRRREMRR